MRWVKQLANDDFERWALVDEQEGHCFAFVDHNLKRIYKGRRVWEWTRTNKYGATIGKGFEPFPKMKWTLEERQAYVAMLVRME